jgi:hypothetical protein
MNDYLFENDNVFNLRVPGVEYHVEPRLATFAYFNFKFDEIRIKRFILKISL